MFQKKMRSRKKFYKKIFSRRKIYFFDKKIFRHHQKQIFFFCAFNKKSINYYKLKKSHSQLFMIGTIFSDFFEFFQADEEKNDILKVLPSFFSLDVQCRQEKVY